MAKSLPSEIVDDTSIPYRVVIDFLEGTLRKQDAIAFARGFIEHHFDAQANSGYYVAPYPGGYIFEVQEGGAGRAYLPGILRILDENPAASGCVQMARRVLEVKKSSTGAYTAILLPEGTEPQNPDKVFPEPGPKLIPFQRSGITALIIGASIFGVGFLALLLCTIAFLVETSGLLSAPLAKINYADLPLMQWQSLTKVAGNKSDTYIKAIKLQNGKWTSVTGTRQDETPDVTAAMAPASAPAASASPIAPAAINSLAPPTVPATSGDVPPGTPVGNRPLAMPSAPASLPPPPIASPGASAH